MAKVNSNIIREVWRALPIAPQYSVSNLGRIVRIVQVGKELAWIGKILKIQTRKDGYVDVIIYINSKPKKFMMHLLVAQVFLPPKPTPDHEINHKNLIKSDNRSENLEWATHAENMQHAEANGHWKHPFGENNRGHKLTLSDIPKIRELLNSGMSDRKIAPLFGVTRNSIRQIRTGQTWSHVKVISPNN